MNVLILCTHNSARSILAEAVLRHIGGHHFQAFSAGSSPRENQRPNPLALTALQQAGISIEGLRSKSWDEFATPGAPVMDLIITVCDNAAGEVCPVWPGRPVTAHWGVPDPVAADGGEEARRRAFQSAWLMLRRRIDLLLALPLEKLDRLAMQQQLRTIGQTAAADER